MHFQSENAVCSFFKKTLQCSIEGPKLSKGLQSVLKFLDNNPLGVFLD